MRFSAWFRLRWVGSVAGSGAPSRLPGGRLEDAPHPGVADLRVRGAGDPEHLGEVAGLRPAEVDEGDQVVGNRDPASGFPCLDLGFEAAGFVTVVALERDPGARFCA